MVPVLSEAGPEGTTPLDPGEAADLIPAHIATRGELNAWGQANIARAVRWLRTRRRGPGVLSFEFIRELHPQRFGETWRWAGKFRRTGENIGGAAESIVQELRKLLDDVTHWKAHRTYGVDEMAGRFHHRLVAIHPFPNGNGRHARLATDALLTECGAAPFTWGAASLVAPGEARAAYLPALRQADQGDYSLLLRFVRS